MPAQAARAGDPQPSNSLYTARGTLGQPPGSAQTGPGSPNQPGPAADADPAAPARLKTQLLEQLESALARTRLHQFMTLAEPITAQTDQPTSHINLEIPVAREHRFDNLNLHIYPEQQRDQRGALTTVWRVMLTIEIPELGPIHVQLSLARQSLKAILWAEYADTLTAVREELGQLASAFGDIGVELEQLECLPGRPTDAATSMGGPILDVRT